MSRAGDEPPQTHGTQQSTASRRTPDAHLMKKAVDNAALEF
jgi:hypothetical protein